MDVHRDAFARLEAASRRSELAALCERHGVGLLVAFGSAIHADERPASDLDLAFSWLPHHHGDYLALLHDLARMARASRVDLVDLDRTSLLVRSHALAGVPLYERHDGAFARAQVAAMLRRMDTEWLRDLELSLLTP